MQKNVPMRQCIGCGERREKAALIRIVRTPEGGVTADPTGKSPGRGAYVCLDAQCVRRAAKRRALDKAFRGHVPPEAYEDLAARIDALASAQEAPDTRGPADAGQEGGDDAG